MSYRVFNGTTWVDICSCNLRVLNSNNIWRAIDPKKCKVQYFTGDKWCEVICDLTCDDLSVSFTRTQTTAAGSVLLSSYYTFPINLTLEIKQGATVIDTETLTFTDVNTTSPFEFTGLTAGTEYTLNVILPSLESCLVATFRTLTE